MIAFYVVIKVRWLLHKRYGTVYTVYASLMFIIFLLLTKQSFH